MYNDLKELNISRLRSQFTVKLELALVRASLAADYIKVPKISAADN